MEHGGPARLRLLAEATSRLAITLDVAQCRQRLVDLVLPDLADWVLLITTDDRDRIAEVTVKHRFPEQEEALQDYSRALQDALLPGPPTQTLLDGATARRISDYDSPTRRAERETWVNDASILDLSDTLGAASLLMLTLLAGHPGQRQRRHRPARVAYLITDGSSRGARSARSSRRPRAQRTSTSADATPTRVSSSGLLPCPSWMDPARQPVVLGDRLRTAQLRHGLVDTGTCAFCGT